jgi:MoaA/NifB/PqqE/SkfB family radical SAM enzyme
MASKIITNYLPELFALGFFRSRPSVVGINLTHRCNQNCVYCEIGKNPLTRENDTLTVDDLLWVIDQMVINKIPRIALQGGEPFLFQGIIDVVAYAGEKNIRTQITTNGMTAHLLGENELNVLKECKTEVNISIDSFEYSIQSFTRGTPAALSNALKSVRKLSEKGIPLTVLTVISKYNYQDLFKSFSLAYEKGIRQVLFQPVIYYSNYPQRPALDDKSQLNVSVDKLEIVMDELNKILRFERKHKIKTNVYRIIPWIKYYLRTAETKSDKMFFDDVLGKFFCRDVYAIIDISYDGGIQPCGLLPAAVSIINNRPSGLMELWSQATAEIKKDLLQGRYPGCCNGCCHHFSRNMLASVFKHPFKNRIALFRMMPLVLSRILWGILKKTIFLFRN